MIQTLVIRFTLGARATGRLRLNDPNPVHPSCNIMIASNSFGAAVIKPHTFHPTPDHTVVHTGNTGIGEYGCEPRAILERKQGAGISRSGYRANRKHFILGAPSCVFPVRAAFCWSDQLSCSDSSWPRLVTSLSSNDTKLTYFYIYIHLLPSPS